MLDLEELGRRVQSLRVRRGLTLQALAEAASVSVSMLSSVERGQKAPTVVVLGRIADGLGVSLASLVATPEADRVILRRAAEQDVVDEPEGWRRVILSPVVPGVNFEWIRSTLPPHCDAGWFPAYAPGSHEYIAVESGRVRLTLGHPGQRAEPVDLAAGDSLYLARDTPLNYANVTDEPCSYYVAALIMRPRLPGRRAGGH
ncbi:helix-turn-helix domain-containing protein [Goodfellowiella coeruleoviolacea]|uniref:Transcriptional regulator, XRE family with cupin sensor n=1 Tax=Goodfellowiella coeruleoviolacea TaxID=334858 RepID=A0AAE3GB42_9PSEU|nr:helix-turn-helix domain-containing protein [Goodfellowiella coeruleoviolacea]MCP2164875.1 transcriptional regulator, XRE family with cupin sensor [Goodfellowiella coeruleoviolacea]